MVPDLSSKAGSLETPSVSKTDCFHAMAGKRKSLTSSMVSTIEVSWALV